MSATDTNEKSEAKRNTPNDGAFALLARFSAVVRHLRSRADSSGLKREHDLSPRQLMMLSHVALLAPVSVSDLAQQMQISLATASQMLTALAQQGIVERHEDPSDHRRTLISLSPTRGNDAAKKLDEVIQPLRDAIASLGNQEFSQLLGSLDAIVARLAEVESRPNDGDQDC